MIIDVHAHVYMDPKIRPHRDSTTFMSAKDQIAVMDSLGVDKAIILPLNDAECPAEPQSIGEVLAICAKYPGRFIPFCNIDPRLPRNPDQIKVADFDHLLGQYKEIGCKGIGEMTARIAWNTNPMLCMLEAAEKLEFAITFHTITADLNSYGIPDAIGLPGLEMVVRRFPRLKFFGHSPAFWAEISGEVTPSDKNAYPNTPVKPGGTLVRLLRENSNLYGDLSAGSGLNALQRDPEHAYGFIEEFQDRLMLGLDYCSIKNDMPHIKWLRSLRDEGRISGEAFEKIMWKNVDRALGLGLA